MKFLITYLLLLLFSFASQAQDAGPITLNRAKAYKKHVKSNKEYGLVDLNKKGLPVYLDLKYATEYNFTKTKLYSNCNTTYLLYPAAAALKKVCDSLATHKLFIKIWDAYRPYAATKLMWELIKDERYVANPKSGSNHNRGLAIDLTLVDSSNTELNMGTGFDNFTDTAHHTFQTLPENILANRKLLKGIMEHFGFKSFESEWWHYSFATKEKMMVIDLGFKKLSKLVK